MSIVSNIHTAIVYESKGQNKTLPQNDQRLVVTIAKADKNGNYGEFLQQTMATSIPRISENEIIESLNEENSKLFPHIVSFLETTQNLLIAERIKSGVKEISTDELSVSKLIEFLEISTRSESWTSERIAEWFAENLAVQITEKLMEKGFADSRIDSAISSYSKLLSETFSSRSAISRNKALEIQKALKLGDSENSQIMKFQARIDKVLNEVSIADSLGL